MKKLILSSFLFLLLLPALNSCAGNDSAGSDSPDNASKSVPASSNSKAGERGDEIAVHSVDLPNYAPDFPPGEGREIFISRCTVCHSLRYVSMQPNFPEATWVKEVDKMRKTWGAHINDDESKAIVSYLVSIKGQK